MTTPFQTAQAELRPLGIRLTQAPGEYIVRPARQIEGGSAFEDLSEAVSFGRSLGAQNQALRQLPAISTRSQRAKKRAAHNRKVAARRKKRVTSLTATG